LRLDFFRNNMGIVLEALLIDFQPLPQIGFLRSANPEKTDTEHGIKRENDLPLREHQQKVKPCRH